MIYDILILSKNEDFNKVKYLLKSIKLNLNGYDNIYLITPNKLNIELEENVINLTDFEVIEKEYKDGIKHRPSWIFQQYMKLFQNVTKHDKYLVIDSDIYINKNIDIFSDEKPNLFIGKDQYHEPYFNYMSNFGIYKKYDKSFISEIMLFDKKIINNFLSRIGLSKSQFFLQSNKIINSNCYISEFELYGNLIQSYHKDEYNIKNIETMVRGKHGEWNDSEIEHLIDSNKNLDIISYHTWI